MLADIALRRRDYSEPDLYNPAGRYGDVRLHADWPSSWSAPRLGWGLVTNTHAGWLTWQGYLLGPFGLGGKAGAWAFANLGVLVALVIGFVGVLAPRPPGDPRPGVAAPAPAPHGPTAQA